MPSFLVGAPPGQIDPLRRLARKRARRVLAPSAKSSGGGLRRYSNEFVPLCAIWLKENFI